MAPQNKWKLDNKLTAMMVEDMMFDPILAAKVLLRLRIPPHEELRLMILWTTFYTNDDSGFSTGKSFTFAMLAAMRSILMRGRMSGILSRTFAQGKLIFEYFDRWYASNPIFRSCIKHAKGRERLIHGTDAWVAHFRGGSQVRVLPPDFAKDAERLRSERWHDGYFDEWTTFGNFEAFNKTIVGRVSIVNENEDCPVRQNHIHLASTPSFTHMPSYSMVKMVQSNVSQGNKNYGLFSVNYRHIPDTRVWKHMVSRKTIFNMQCTLPKGVLKAEVDGVWQKDSSSYYNSPAIENSRWTGNLYLPRRLKQDDMFFAGFDVARGGSDQKHEGSGDDFSISIFRLGHLESKPRHCLTIRRNKIKAAQMAGIVHLCHRLFGLSVVVYDPGGGGLFVKDELQKNTQLIEGRHEPVVPIIETNDVSGAIGDRILIPVRRRDPWIFKMYNTMASDSVLINKMHESFRNAIESDFVMLAPHWEGWEGDSSIWDADAMREHLNREANMPQDQRIMADMDLAVTQLIQVDIKRDENGQPEVDSHNMFKFKSKHKKDSAYGLVYAYFGYTLWLNLHAFGHTISGGAVSQSVIASRPM